MTQRERKRTLHPQQCAPDKHAVARINFEQNFRGKQLLSLEWRVVNFWSRTCLCMQRLWRISLGEKGIGASTFSRSLFAQWADVWRRPTLRRLIYNELRYCKKERARAGVKKLLSGIFGLIFGTPRERDFFGLESDELGAWLEFSIFSSFCYWFTKSWHSQFSILTTQSLRNCFVAQRSGWKYNDGRVISNLR